MSDNEPKRKRRRKRGRRKKKQPNLNILEMPKVYTSIDDIDEKFLKYNKFLEKTQSEYFHILNDHSKYAVTHGDNRYWKETKSETSLSEGNIIWQLNEVCWLQVNYSLNAVPWHTYSIFWRIRNAQRAPNYVANYQFGINAGGYIGGALKSGKDEYKASNDGTMVHYSHDRYIKSSKVAPNDGSLENKWIWLYLGDIDVSENNLSKHKKEDKIDSTTGLVKLNVSVSGGNPNWCEGLSLDVMYIYAPGFHEFVGQQIKETVLKQYREVIVDGIVSMIVDYTAPCFEACPPQLDNAKSDSKKPAIDSSET